MSNQATLPVSELARRICTANHRAEIIPNSGVPCSEHLHLAKSFYGLTKPSYAKTLAVIVDVAGEPMDEDD